jgi:hypothetical protein
LMKITNWAAAALIREEVTWWGCSSAFNKNDPGRAAAAHRLVRVAAALPV